MDTTLSVECEHCLEPADATSHWYQSFGVCNYRCALAVKLEA